MIETKPTVAMHAGIILSTVSLNIPDTAAPDSHGSLHVTVKHYKILLETLHRNPKMLQITSLTIPLQGWISLALIEAAVRNIWDEQ